MLASTTTKIDAQGRDGSFVVPATSRAQTSPNKRGTDDHACVHGERRNRSPDGIRDAQEVAVAALQPTGKGVAIRKRSTGGRFAVIRFSGRLSEKLAKENEAKLASG